MSDCSRDLHEAPEYGSDAIIGQMISLRRFDDQIHDSFFTEDTIDLPLNDPRIMMNYRFTESQLDQKRIEICDEEFHRGTSILWLYCSFIILTTTVVLDLSSSFTDMQLHSIALRPFNTSMLPVTADSTRLNALLATLDACKRYLDKVIALPVSEYHLISFVEWMRLPGVIITLARLCMPNDSLAEAQWDVKMAHDRARLDLYLDSLCYRMQGLTTYNKIDGSPVDFWFAMRMIMEPTRAWYVRKISTKSATSASNASALPTPDTLQISGDGSRECYATADPGRGAFGMNVMLGGLDMGGNSHGNDMGRFGFMSDPNFDMDKFLDWGLWGDESYTGMGFGGGMHS